MNYQFTIPQSFPQMTVKELLEDYFLIPRKIRHFLRTKKHVLVNGETINWQSPVQKGDQIQLIFDADDYPEKELQPETRVWSKNSIRMSMSSSSISPKV